MPPGAVPLDLDDHSLRRTLDSLLEGFQVVDHQWIYRYVNPAAAAHGRRTVADLIGQSMTTVYPGIERTPLFELLERCLTLREPQRLENLFMFEDGSERWFELRVEPVPQGICICSVDIHDRKLAEDELRRVNAELEARVDARTRDLQDANSELDAFAHSVSHDLRGPLRHIAGFGELLRERAATTLDAQGVHLLNRMTDAAGRLTRMVDALLLFARTSRRPLDVGRVSLDDALARARLELEPSAAGRAIEWQVGPLPDVAGDPVLLHQVWINLLSNALKYTSARDRARIEITQVAGSGPNVVVQVRDNGAGFDPVMAHRLFGVFQRLHGAEFEGTGVGLANVRRIVHRHGGQVWAEGEAGRGAAFFVELPAAAPR